ncbi:Sec1 family domain-containing protein 2 [Blattella germanica]|nr:Sec1 family domain-containing protein 2 [Blattella germanica]
MVLTLHQFCQIGWREICKKVKKAVVYVDNQAAECLHWNGGLNQMISAGAITVKEFSSFENGKPEHKKAVFILCSPVYGTTKMILQDLIRNSSFEYCVLITSAHARVHLLAKYGGYREGIEDMSLFHALEEEMLEWMGNMNYTVEVIYSPLFILPLTEMIFLTPPFREMIPITEAHIPKIFELYMLQHKDVNMQSSDTLSSIELPFLPLELQISVHQLVSCLHSLFVTLEMQEDIYSLGHLSGLVAGQLEALHDASNRRKTAPNHCSLILIDRTLDLASVTSYNSDSLLDKILAVLPRLPGHSNDVAVNMSPICNVKVVIKKSFHSLCAAKILLEKGIQLKAVAASVWLQFFVGWLAVICYWTERISKERSSALGNVVLAPGCLAQPNSDICSQQALAVTQTLRSPRFAQLEVIVSIEKVLLQNLGSSKHGIGVLAQITSVQASLLLNRQKQQHPLDNPVLIVFILGGITAQEVKLIQEMVVSSGQETKVLVGGTRLLSPNDAVESVFVKDPLMQDVL